MFKVMLLLVVVTLVVSTPDSKSDTEDLWPSEYKNLSASGRYYSGGYPSGGYPPGGGWYGSGGGGYGSGGGGGYGSYHPKCAKEGTSCGRSGDLGVCRAAYCHRDERECPYTKCSGTDCHCCKPLKKKCAKEGTSCGLPGDLGVCRANDCHRDERECPYTKCSGTDCHCCKPLKKKCIYEEGRCGDPGDWGKCRPGSCLRDEREYSQSDSECPGTDCLCCKKQKRRGCEHERSYCGRNRDGICRTNGCKADESVCQQCKSDCPGDDCQCCRRKLPPMNGCVDEYADCQNYIDDCNKRSREYGYMTKNCRKTCGFCGKAPSEGGYGGSGYGGDGYGEGGYGEEGGYRGYRSVSIAVSNNDCVDKYEEGDCSNYMKDCREGAKNYSWMLEKCKKTCGFCNGE